jgi:DNA-directed RNA polymerase specialized sigma24 family protein
MDEHEFIAERNGANLTHLRTMAHWVLGSQSEADDALEEACTRLSRHPPAIDNLGERLTTLLAQICLDRLRARAAQSEGLSANARVANVSM